MSLRIAITGATGLVGSKLIPFLISKHHQVTQITRRKGLEKDQTSVIVWDPDIQQLDAAQMEGFDVIIHLAGTNVGERWNKEYKKSILDSRVKGTRLFCQRLSTLKQKPKVLLSASAVGFYGNHSPEVILDEASPKGHGFLPDVCQQWEEETKVAAKAGIRVVNMRMGVVLSKYGGALAKMWMPFQLGLGGILGSGEQMMSWVALDEIPLIAVYLIQNENISGPINVVAPNTVSKKEFTKILGQVIKRPVIFPMPVLAVRALFGEMGQNLLLEGSRVLPNRLQEYGYQFSYADLKLALEKVVK